MSWVDLGPVAALPERGARCVRVGPLAIAVFRTSTGEVFALRDQCPHRGGPLSQGIVHGTRVTCPLHDWVIDLKTGQDVLDILQRLPARWFRKEDYEVHRIPFVEC